MSSTGLDMALEDIIKTSKKSGGGRGRNRASGPGPGPARHFPNRVANRTAPYAAVKVTWGSDLFPLFLSSHASIPLHAPETTWQHDLYGEENLGRSSAIETGTKLFLSNLDYGVSNEDLKELFAEVGDLKRYSIHYDRSGRSKGTAEVVFSRRGDAEAAVKRYNNVQLDGKLMKIEIMGRNIATPAAPPATNGTFGNSNAIPRGGQGRAGALGRPRGSRGGRGFGRDRGHGQGRGRGEKLSQEDLDADLEKYHEEAKQNN
ncbi:THO complex subunit 4A-like isoform X1 [Carya illinoinensis]|uniref:THO complex subunit 4A-like isoform X1 n=1 Tax=Carya illinoinensis TaxID=32201 RepID=UPI001C723EC0|nr:THO complex subunit 4A-like isoform X1 [Carya illinoinensis]